MHNYHYTQYHKVEEPSRSQMKMTVHTSHNTVCRKQRKDTTLKLVLTENARTDHIRIVDSVGSKRNRGHPKFRLKEDEDVIRVMKSLWK